MLHRYTASYGQPGTDGHKTNTEELPTVLQTLQQTVQAFELTAKELEKAARGIERATLVFQLDVPHTLGSIERAGDEISSLGRSINIMGGNKSKTKEKSKSHGSRNAGVPRPGEESSPEVHGRYGMHRVVQDISTMTLVRPWALSSASLGHPAAYILDLEHLAHELACVHSCLRITTCLACYQPSSYAQVLAPPRPACCCSTSDCSRYMITNQLPHEWQS